MMRLLHQTRDEKITMYMKLTKLELIEMLINANKALDSRSWLGAEWSKFDEIPCSVGPNTCLTS